jgi:hypothetical protein
VLSEVSLHQVTNKAITSILTADGVPFVGKIDCFHRRGINKGGDFGELYDPPGTAEAIDWKRKGNTKTRDGTSTLLEPVELIRTVQMSGYGEAIRRAIPDIQYVRLSHGYFPERGGPPRKVTKLHVVDDFPKAWEYVEGVVRTIKDVARETDAEHVPINKNACDAYGGCPYRETCSGYQRNSMDNLWNKVAVDIKKENEVGLLTNIPNVVAQPVQLAAPMQQVPPQYTFVAPPQPDLNITLAENAAALQRAQLADEEAALRAQQAKQQAVGVPQPDLAAAWQRIQSYGRGVPSLYADAAQALAQAFGVPLGPDGGFTGGGQLASIKLEYPSHIFQIEQELAAQAANQANPPQPPPPPPPVQSMGLLAPNAPSSVPVLAAQMPAIAPPAVQVPAAAQQPVAQSTTIAPLPTEAPKRGRGRPRKTDTASSTGALAESLASPAQGVSTQGSPLAGAVSTSPSTGAGELEVYINCRPNYPTSGLDSYVDFVNNELARRYCVDAQGRPTIQDVRCAPKDSPLAFGGWKGAVHELVRTNPPSDGAFHLDTGVDELKEIVADAMRVVCSQRGGLFVQGTR